MFQIFIMVLLYTVYIHIGKGLKRNLKLYSFIGIRLSIHCITKPMRATHVPCYDKFMCMHVGNSSWESLVQHLEERLTVQLDCVNRLSTQEMSEGDRICHIVKEWSEREEVTVSLFHEICRQLGNGPQVHKILSQMEQTERDRILLSLEDRGNSRIQDI